MCPDRDWTPSVPCAIGGGGEEFPWSLDATLVRLLPTKLHSPTSPGRPPPLYHPPNPQPQSGGMPVHKTRPSA